MNTGSSVAQLLQAAVGAGMAPGAAAIWGSSKEDLSVAFAGTSAIGGPKVTNQTVYDLASLTKPLVVSSLFLIACRQGLLSLESRVGEVLTGAVHDRWQQVSLRHLLTHTSGLPDWVPLYAATHGDPGLLLTTLLDLPLSSPPGSRVVYSCPGFILLGHILEQVFGEPLHAVFKRTITGPLDLDEELGYGPGFKRTSLAGGASSAQLEEELTREAGFDPAFVPPTGPGLPDDGNSRFLGAVSGNAGLFGTISGVFSLALEYIEACSSLFSPEEIQLATRSWTDGLNQARGLGWQIASTPECSAGPSLTVSAFGHTGFTGTSLWVDPRREHIMVLLANRNHPAHRNVDLHPLRRRFHALAI